MKKYLPLIQKTPLFSGISDKETESLLGCLTPRVISFEKDTFVLRFGEQISELGLVLEGEAHILQEDFWGNRNLVAAVRAGELFAESYACTEGARLGVSVLAVKPAKVLFLNVRRMMTGCTAACSFHARLMRNLLSLLAQKNLLLNRKLGHVSQRSTREKLLSYLSAEADRQGAVRFEIPFNRQQLADYLSVDRSAMSAALCRLRDEGLLYFERNRFELREKGRDYQA